MWVFDGTSWFRYLIFALIIKSLKFVRLLYPIIGGFWKSGLQFELLQMMFQLFIICFLISFFFGLKGFPITGVSVGVFCLIANKLYLYLLALLQCFVVFNFITPFHIILDNLCTNRSA